MEDVQNPCEILTPHERIRLAGKTMISLNAIRRWERGEKILARTKRELDHWAKRLGFPTPPKVRGD
jgi:hypothetical protein